MLIILPLCLSWSRQAEALKADMTGRFHPETFTFCSGCNGFALTLPFLLVLPGDNVLEHLNSFL